MMKEGAVKEKHRSITIRILKLCGLTSLIASVLVGTVSVIVTGVELNKVVSTQMITLAEQVGKAVEESIDSKYSYLSGVATNQMVYGATDDKVAQKRFLNSIMDKNDGELIDIGFIDSSGHSLAKNLYTVDDFSAEPFFTEAMAGKQYVSNPFDYEESPNKMVYVFSVPVHQGGASDGEVVGVLYQMMDVCYFSDLVGDIKFGKTGFVYLVDSEGTNLGHYDNDKVVTRENAVKMFGDKPEFASLISFLKGAISSENGYSTYKYNGSTRVGGYSVCTDRNWHIIVLAEQIELFRGQVVSINYTIIIVIVVQIIGIISSILLVRRIMGPLKKLKEINMHMSEGDLTDEMEKPSPKKAKDEIGEMVDSTDMFKAKLKEVIKETKASSTTLFDISVNLNELARQSESAAENVCKAIEDVSQSTVNQAVEVESAATDVGTLAEAIDSIKSDVESLMVLSESAMEAEKIAKEALADLIQSNGRTTVAFGEIADQIKETDLATQRISEAANLITAIASQTNLLSLNASIEAARAGEAGKGFAVVATEIQQLSEQSDNAAATIQEIIKQLTEGSAKSIKKMDEALILIKEQEERLQKTEEESGMVDEDVEEMEDSAIQIRKSVDSCEEVKNNVNRIVTNLSAISQENAASAEETNAAMEELNANIGIISQTATNLAELSDELKKYMSFWTVEKTAE